MWRRCEGLDVGFNASGAIIPIMDYAMQSNRFLTLCGVYPRITVANLPFKGSIGMAAYFFSPRRKDLLEVFFCDAATGEGKRVLSFEFKADTAGMRNSFFQIVDMEIERPGLFYFEGRLNGAVFHRYVVPVMVVSTKG